ncbi:MAG: aminodeoxychorismate synthase component I [Candidimonas sp.]|nr:MAG: aminodeoxychorismate synthase component I [Candidimonas sp.]TAM21050.1 MAG: aminodeoxychorismate synthase component I [Candidimonas sp.]
MLCRFENRLSGQAIELLDFAERIEVCSVDELPAAFEQIAAAQQKGCWVALLLDYELGEWLDSACRSPIPAGLASDAGAGHTTPRLTALVYQQASREPVWDAPLSSKPIQLESCPLIAKADYLKNIDILQGCIRRGEIYQANYTFPIQLRTQVASRDLYRTIAAQHPTAHAAYIEDDRRSILSFSPELFVARQGATLTVRPMKGTAPRHNDPDLDQRSAQTLLHSEKNRAENLMIVDLLRNDLGRLAVPGSVKVEALFTLERYPSVWTLTSTITAQAPNKSLEDILRALFPCGSITGAPKIAAMKKIQTLETSPRGIYCGSLGWLAPNGDLSLNVAIRTMEMPASGPGRFGVGGGIVHDSDPELEWKECLWKARILRLDSPSSWLGESL